MTRQNCGHRSGLVDRCGAGGRLTAFVWGGLILTSSCVASPKRWESSGPIWLRADAGPDGAAEAGGLAPGRVASTGQPAADAAAPQQVDGGFGGARDDASAVGGPLTIAIGAGNSGGVATPDGASVPGNTGSAGRGPGRDGGSESPALDGIAGPAEGAIGARDAGGGGDGGRGGADAGAMNPDGLDVVNVDSVWSRHPAAFSLVTRGNLQFVAYYDAARQLTVAQRTIGAPLPDGGVWTTMRLGSLLVPCDSHNYVTMAIDSAGYLHVSGNMHGVPLVYYRSARPLEVTSLVAATPMVGTNEAQVTYPQFFFDNSDHLIFAYRDGASGKGNYVFNRYDPNTRAWVRLLNTPLIDGSSADLSAYPVGPVRGPDGWFHLVWVWRDSADAATNHDLSYAKTQDLIHWQNAAGQPLPLPIVYTSPEIVVDPVQAGGGMINNNTKIGFDAQQRVVLSYHKNDAAGTQLFNARREGNSWALHKTSSWQTTWAFGGQGTLEFDIVVEPVAVQSNGDLVQKWYHAQYGGWGAFRLDPNTLAAQAQIPPPLPYPSALDTPTSSTPGMVVQWAEDSGTSPDANKKYLLRWETLPSNRDQCPATAPGPEPLRLYGIPQHL